MLKPQNLRFETRSSAAAAAAWVHVGSRAEAARVVMQACDVAAPRIETGKSQLNWVPAKYLSTSPEVPAERRDMVVWDFEKWRR